VARAETPPLRVVVACDDQTDLADAESLVRGLGHAVVTLGLAANKVDEGSFTRRGRPDLAIVGPGPSTARALDLIARLAEAATCPLIAFLTDADDRLITEAAKAGVLTCVVGENREAWAPIVEIALRPFVENHDLEGALRRRAVIERAKGVLMERHGVREDEAFELLRAEARGANQRVVDVASAVLTGHRLLPYATTPAKEESGSELTV
jgi:AmiR/NasT family two-component response regulator